MLLVDFTSDGTPVAGAAGNLWFVCSIGCNINVANCTNHKFPTATPTGVPSEVKSTVAHYGQYASASLSCALFGVIVYFVLKLGWFIGAFIILVGITVDLQYFSLLSIFH